jgi:SDR family mycofactocin-dependent oxidoreductase
MGSLDGKIAVVSGAARGQGRSHCVRLAEEGADIIAFDICADVETVPYPGATSADLETTVAEVEKLGRRISSAEVDVRDWDSVRATIDAGVAELGGLDIVSANAGILSFFPAAEMTGEQWKTVVDVNLTGVWNVARASIPHLINGGRGGSMILTSSSAAHIGFANLCHYAAAKGGVVGLMQSLAVELGPHMIRVNTLHPTTVKSPMVMNQAVFDLFVPDAEVSVEALESEEGLKEAKGLTDAYSSLNAMPVPWVEPVDISNALVFLASDQARYVSGTEFRVDAGSAVK